MQVTLAGGPNPGTYMTRASELACRKDLAGPGGWTVRLTDWAGPKTGLRSLQLVLPSPDAPEGFYLGLVFGDFFTGTVHEIETRPDASVTRGSGRATVTRQQDADIVAVDGKTGDSVAITATITCRNGPEMEHDGR